MLFLFKFPGRPACLRGIDCLVASTACCDVRYHAQYIYIDSSRFPANDVSAVVSALLLWVLPRAAAAIAIPLVVWAWNRRVRYWYYACYPIAYPGDVVPNRLERRYASNSSSRILNKNPTV